MPNIVPHSTIWIYGCMDLHTRMFVYIYIYVKVCLHSYVYISSLKPILFVGIICQFTYLGGHCAARLRDSSDGRQGPASASGA